MTTTKEPVVAAAIPTVEEKASDDAKADNMSEEYMRNYYANQEKVSVKTREDEWVQVNGYTFIIKKNERVMVPKDIADILDAAGRI